jgi:hypothetical protein
MTESGIAQFIITHLVDWAAYILSLLIGLLYTIQQQKAKIEKDAYTKELLLLHEALAKTISQDYFKEHVARTENERVERRSAEHTIREALGTLDMRLQIGLDKLDTKMDGKLDTIINNMLQVAQSPHNRRTGDA